MTIEDELAALGTATVYEASGVDCFLPATLRPVWPEAHVVGTALPVSMAAGDNLPLHVALEHASAGDVLVADGQGAAHGYWGEILASAARHRGVRGLVIDGGVRDTVRLRELDFPTFSSCVSMRGTRKADAGTVGTPIHLGGVTVRRGDLVLADADGVLVLAADLVERTAKAARARQDAEAGYLRRIADGESTMAVYGFRALVGGAS